MLTKTPSYNLIRNSAVILFLSSTSTLSVAVTPIQANFIMGLDIQGQRLNLYNGCAEGNVTCDDMLLVAPDLARMAFVAPTKKDLNRLPYAIKLYPAKTEHSTCADGITPCRFQGYSFDGKDITGFINPNNNEITIYNNRKTNTRKTNSRTFSYQDNTTYLPLMSQAGLINTLYADSDKALNNHYNSAHKEVTRLYGKKIANDLKKDQVNWVIKRSKECGANDRHLPRTQSEKVCFIQKNEARSQEYFLWID